jgi:hypothetical protein
MNGGNNARHQQNEAAATGTPSISQTTKNAWQAVELSSRKDGTNLPSSTTNANTTGHQQILFLNTPQSNNTAQ